MAAVSAWIAAERPRLLVSDVSVEVALLARLHGVPVVSVVLPGDRGDRAHRTGYAVSTGLVATWPRHADGMVRGLPSTDERRLHHVGGLSRLPVAVPREPRAGHRSVLVLSGRGGGHPDEGQIAAAAANADGWRWRVLGGSGEWSDDPGDALADADVVVVQAGQSAVADVAASRRPAVVVPAERPFDEQAATARVLASGTWPCRVLPSFGSTDWAALLDEVAALDGSAWSPWCDGEAADRFAEYLESWVDAPEGRP